MADMLSQDEIDALLNGLPIILILIPMIIIMKLNLHRKRLML
jgi:hypothetical protein